MRYKCVGGSWHGRLAPDVRGAFLQLGNRGAFLQLGNLDVAAGNIEARPHLETYHLEEFTDENGQSVHLWRFEGITRGYASLLMFVALG